MEHKTRSIDQRDELMSSFRDVSATFAAAPQIGFADIETAKREGFTAIICNRPDNEDSGQINAADIGAVCAQHGLSFTHIPVAGGVSQSQIDAMAAALDGATGPALAYCRSGTRSTNLWAMAEAANGADADALVTAAAGAGYDLSGLAPTLRSLASR
jgi:uncharacterized protein (TIGR01244 family)